MKYETVIGLEIHAQLKTRSKMFCACANDPIAAAPNTNICPICTGHPGTLPVPNAGAIAKVMMVGLALGSRIANESKFDRKHYFYPDLPKGYQISQYDAPLCVGGQISLLGLDKAVNIRRVHIEEDTGRLTHDLGSGASLVDFNRAGVPLMELVTEPDLRSAEEASVCAQEVQTLFRYLGVSDADMEKGQLRVEANISVRRQGDKPLGTKVEVKNINSFRHVRDAIAYEAARHVKALKKGQKIIQDTRGWDPDKSVTISQRGKEEASDYRYFPEPDIPAFQILEQSDSNQSVLPSIAELKRLLPELPWERRELLSQKYELNLNDVEFFVTQKAVGDYLLDVTESWRTFEPGQRLKHIKKAAALILTHLQNWLKENPNQSIKDLPISAAQWAEFTEVALSGAVSNVGVQELFSQLIKGGGSARHLVEHHNLAQVFDTSVLEPAIKEVLTQNPKAVEEYKAGKAPALQFLIGKAMAATKGKANPQAVAELLKAALTK